VRKKQIAMGLVTSKRARRWKATEIALLRKLYADTPTMKLARILERTPSQVYQQADRQRLRKSAAYLASPEACRLRRGDRVGAAFQFKKGHVPANKGMRRPGWAPGRMKQTQFRKGERRGAAARNWVPLGTIRADCEGYLRIKVREHRDGEHSGFGNTQVWPFLQRHVWQEQRGPIPPGHAIVFRNGKPSDCDIQNLECISRGELMRRNTIHNLPPQLKATILTLGKLKRRVREYEKHADRLT
jgi:hypothetical protein